LKVLFVCHRFPFPADGGGKIRALKLIEHLRLKHQVHVFSMTRDSVEASGRQHLEASGLPCTAPEVSRLQTLFSLLIGWARGLSMSEAYFCSQVVRVAMKKLLERQTYDLVIVHSSSMGRLVLSVKAPKIMDFCDMDSAKWASYAQQGRGPMRWVYRREARLIQFLERELAEATDVSCVATPVEMRLLLSIAPAVAKPAWFTNGVDTEFFRPVRSDYKALQLCFVGRMDYLPNVDCVEWFVHNCWRSLRERHPTACFMIIGAEPIDRVRSLATVDGVVVTGTVPDVRPYLAESVAMVAPLRIARGIQNKILEAMAMGVPVITSTLCHDSLPSGLAECVVRADDKDSVINACLHLIDNQKARRRRAVMGRRAIRSEATWEASFRAFDSLIEKAMSPS
jgi:sugar transferase (PEP-CTERM/EpsH1 system associated)